jgi:hypothetical protein
MIGLSVTVSGEDVAAGLRDDPEECALFLAQLGLSMGGEEREELAEFVANMARHEKVAILILARRLAGACGDAE